MCFIESKVPYSRKHTIVLLAITGTLSLQHLHQSLYCIKPGFVFFFEKNPDISPSCLTHRLRQCSVEGMVMKRRDLK